MVELIRDAKTNLDTLFGMLGSGVSGLILKDLHDADELNSFPKADIIIDAIFGTGFAGAVRGSEVESLSKGRHNILTFRRSISMLQNSRILVDLSQFSVQVP